MSSTTSRSCTRREWPVPRAAPQQPIARERQEWAETAVISMFPVARSATVAPHSRFGKVYREGSYATLTSERSKLLECWGSCLNDLPLADHVCGLNPSQRGRRRMERFEAQHWSCNSFDEAVILLDDVVEIFGLDNADDPANAGGLEDDVDTLQTSKISATLVDDNAGQR